MELETFKTTIIPLKEKLLAYSSKLTESRFETEDIVQDVFLKLWSIRERLDEYESVEALAFRMTKNKALDELKRSQSERFENIEISEFNTFHTATNPEMIVEEKDMVNHVKRLIERLPSLQQAIIRMKDVEGYELQEIAEITGTQIESVRVNLSRARKRIREQLIQLNNRMNKKDGNRIFTGAIH